MRWRGACKKLVKRVGEFPDLKLKEKGDFRKNLRNREKLGNSVPNAFALLAAR